MTEEELHALNERHEDKKTGVLASFHGVADGGAMAARNAQLDRLAKNALPVAVIDDGVRSAEQNRLFQKFVRNGHSRSGEPRDNLVGVSDTVETYAFLNPSYGSGPRRLLLEHVGKAINTQRQYEEALRKRQRKRGGNAESA